jgi:phosphatidylglycerophosphatase A
MPDTLVPPVQSKGERPSLPVRLIATGLFSGYSPFAPGTAGSLVGLAIYFLPGFESTLLLAPAAVVTFFIGVFASARMEKALGEDPPVVVVDEVVGMWISLLFLPKGVWIAGLSFLLFRFFDIVKPPPARHLEALQHGWGIMLDDVAAAVYANAATRLAIFLLPALS